MIKRLADPAVERCVFHSVDFVTVHHCDDTVRAFQRVEGVWRVTFLRTASQVLRYRCHLAELGERVRNAVPQLMEKKA